MDIKSVFNDIKSIVPDAEILLNEPMSKHTTFRIGGPADIMILPSAEYEIIEILKYCNCNSVPIFIMGNGSNLLVRDKGIRGIVLKIGESFSDATVQDTKILAQAGILLSTLSRLALREGLTGLEFASGIPGTLGGAVTMNAGAYGGEMKDVVVAVNVVDMKGQRTKLDSAMLEFGYRTSAIQRDGLVVLDVIMELNVGDAQEIRATMNKLNRCRREKQPLSYPSGGSTFKRPEGYFAGKLIQDAGLKGYRVGDAQVSTKHSGFIVNIGNATCADVVQLIEIIQQTVYKKFGVELYPELKIVGEE
ncbi:MAG TPA: UDP-N-acetylmuramate dehydrogenase [Clostridiales bacterium]|nr:UDP-N-acetylmuramate dehydrogenase [Clostridiales bacterium]